MAVEDLMLPALLESIRDRCMLPASDDTLNDTRLLRLINDELQGYMSELLVSTREEYLLQVFDVTATAAGQQRFRIPPRAAAAAIRQITIVQDGVEWAPQRLEPEATVGRTFELMPLAQQAGWYQVEGDDILLPEALGGTATLRFRVVYMPKLVSPDDAANVSIQSISVDRTSFVHLAETGHAPVTPFDFIRVGGGNQPMGLDSTRLSYVPGTHTVTMAAGTTVPEGIQILDWVVAAGTTIVPPLPEAFVPVLCQRVAYVALRAIGDPKAQAALEQLMEMKAHALTLAQPRTMSSPRVIVNRFGPGWRR